MGAPRSLSLRPVKRAHQQVADQLRELVLAGTLGVGEGLPTEAELCERWYERTDTAQQGERTG